MTQASLETHVTELIRKHNLSTDALTEAQLAAAIRQAIESGDFTRCVMADQSGQMFSAIPFTGEDGEKHHYAPLRQQVVYEPFREVNRLRALYNELLYAVSRRFVGETRHETALRYIRAAEEAALNSSPVERIPEQELTNK